MFGSKFATLIRRDKKTRRGQQADEVEQQVKKVLQESDQKLILMVRG